MVKRHSLARMAARPTIDVRDSSVLDDPPPAGHVDPEVEIDDAPPRERGEQEQQDPRGDCPLR
jgi:hypothetical protein